MSTLLVSNGLIGTLTSFIGGLLYPLFAVIFWLIDAVQAIFQAFAGIGTSSYDTPGLNVRDEIYGGSDSAGNALGGGEREQGLVYYLMQQEIVVNLLLSIMTLALILVIVFTVMAFIKNVYASKQKGWKEIVGNALKGLANFIFLPICCLLGVWLGNILLQAINGATSYGGATNMSRKLFIACAYNANEYRNVEEGKELGRTNAVKAYMQGYNVSETEAQSIIPEGKSNAYYAEIVDQVFSETDIDIHFYISVETYYSLYQINYLILIVGGAFMLYALGSLAFAMVRRMFFILVLFVVSPALCAMYPLDEGKAVGSWKSKFIEQVLSAYGAVAGLNIFFSLLPYIDNISVFAVGVLQIDEIVSLFVMVSGLMVVKELIQMLSGFVGGDNALNSGSSLMKGASGKVTKPLGTAVSKAGGALVRASAAKSAGGSWHKSIWKSIGKDSSDLGNSALKWLTGGAVDIKGTVKNTKDAMKEGKAEGTFDRSTKEYQEKVSAAYEALRGNDPDPKVDGGALKAYNDALETYNSTDPADADARETARAALETAGKNLQVAQETYNQTLASFTDDVQGAAIAKMAKSNGISVEDQKERITSARSIGSQIEGLQTRHAGVERYDEAINRAIALAQRGGNLTAAKQIAVDTLKIPEEAIDQLLRNRTYLGGGSDLDRMRRLMEQFRDGGKIQESDMKTPEDRAAARKFNKAVGKEEEVREDYSAMAKAFSEAIEKLNASGGIREEDSKGREQQVVFSPDALEELQQHLIKGEMSDVMSSSIVKALEAQSKREQKNLQEQLSQVKAIRKLIEELRKK